MSKRQTRRSISLSREDHADLMAFADQHGASASQVVARGIKALLTGEIELGAVLSPLEVAAQTQERRGQRPPRPATPQSKPRTAVVFSQPVIRLPSRRPPPPAFCSICVETISPPDPCPPNWTPNREPLGRSAAMVNVCDSCQTKPSSGRLSGASAGGLGSFGVGEGNRRAGKAPW